MKKILLFLSVLMTCYSYSQKSNVNVIAFKGEVTSTIRDTYDVPTGEYWLIYNSTTTQLEGAADDDVWGAIGGGSGDLSESDIDTFSELDAIVADKSLFNLEDAQTITGNKTSTGSTVYYAQQSPSTFLFEGGSDNEVWLFNRFQSTSNGQITRRLIFDEDGFKYGNPVDPNQTLDYGRFVLSGLTAERNFTFQDSDGTVAFTSDITGTNSGTNTGDQTITLTGDVTGSGTGSFAATIASDAVEESMLKAVNSPTDEYVLTYESTTGDFEWQEEGSSASGYVGFRELISGRIAMNTDNSWVSSSSSAYGPITRETHEQNAGTATDPLIEWEDKGYFMPEGAIIDSISIVGQSNNIEVTDVQFQFYKVVPDTDTSWESGVDNDTEVTPTELYDGLWVNNVDGDQYTFTGAIDDDHKRTFAMSTISSANVMERDGYFSVYAKPTGTITSVRYFEYTGTIYYRMPETVVGSTAHTGDVAGGEVLTIQADAVEESMLDALNSPTDEYVLTYESSSGEFEWEANASLPADDGTSIAQGSADATKQVRIEADTNVPTSTTVVLTAPATDLDLDEVLISDITGEPSGAYTVKNVVGISQEDLDGGTPVTGTIYLVDNAKVEYTKEIPLGAVGHDVATGTDLTFVYFDEAITITSVSASVKTAGTTSVITYDINLDDGSPASILSTKLTIDATERFSSTAATAAVISDATIPADSFLTIDCDTADSGDTGADGTILIKYTVD